MTLLMVLTIESKADTRLVIISSFPLETAEIHISGLELFTDPSYCFPASAIFFYNEIRMC